MRFDLHDPRAAACAIGWVTQDYGVKLDRQVHGRQGAIHA
jgi:hypothetical protein